MQRRAQKPITIRSDRAAERLALLTLDGRSQAAVIEEALDKLPLPEILDDREARMSRIMTILKRSSLQNIPSMEEFDRREYDHNGNPR